MTQLPTLSDAAEEVRLIEKTEFRPEFGNTSFERRFSNPGRNLFLGWHPVSGEIRNYLVAGCVVDGAFRGLLNSKGFIKGSGYLLPEQFLESLRVDEAQLVQPQTNRTVIIGSNVASGNYYHWVTQSLPSIDICWRKSDPTSKLSVLLPRLNVWQEESLSLLEVDGLSRITVDDANKQYQFHGVEFCEVLNGGAAFSLSTVTRQTYARLRNAAGSIGTKRSRIYVSRQDAPSRRMLSEATLVENLLKKGFEIVIPGSLSFVEQVRIFSNAELVVGPHGAGLTNIAFCQPGTVVYELVPASYPNTCFFNLAYIGQLHYWADGFDSPGDSPPNVREWDVDIQTVLERISEIEIVLTELKREEQLKPISAMDFLSGKPGQFWRQADTLQQPVVAPKTRLIRFVHRLLGR